MLAIWVTDYLRRIPVGAMTDDHIRNCIGAIQNGEILRPTCDGLTNAEWVLVFQAELVRRSRTAIAQR